MFVTPHLLRLDTWPWVEQLEGKVDLELAAHPRDDQLNIDGIGDDGAGEVSEVARVSPGGRAQRLAIFPAQPQVAIHGQAPLDSCAREDGFEDNFTLQGASWTQGAPILGLQRCDTSGVLHGNHCQLHPLNHTDSYACDIFA